VLDVKASLGESPLWSVAEQVLYWVDINAPALNRFDPATGENVAMPMPESIGCVALRQPHGFVVALRAGVWLARHDGTLETKLADAPYDPASHRFNDGRCDRQGRFWAGTMSDVRRDPVGTLYRLDPDLSCTPLRNAIIIPNSLAWSPDGRTMYFADTNRHTIWAWDYDPASGAATGERVFADTGAGRPDGSCVDADGCLWNAEYGAARIVRYTPGGKVDRTIELPVANPTCCCFGGAQLDELFITSARQWLSATDLARQPLAGSVFALRPGVHGLPESRFRG
jgi:sugar lactone lactonase YvrE